MEKLPVLDNKVENYIFNVSTINRRNQEPWERWRRTSINLKAKPSDYSKLEDYIKKLYRRVYKIKDAITLYFEQTNPKQKNNFTDSLDHTINQIKVVMSQYKAKNDLETLKKHRAVISFYNQLLFLRSHLLSDYLTFKHYFESDKDIMFSDWQQILFDFHVKYKGEQQIFKKLREFNKKVKVTNHDYESSLNLMSNIIKKEKTGKSVDLSPYFPPVRDQGRYGICTLTSVISVLDFQANWNCYFNDTRTKIGWNESNLFSLDYLWYQSLFSSTKDWKDRPQRIKRVTRPADGSPEHDVLTPESILENLDKFGICFEKDWSSDLTGVLKRPTNTAVTEALKHKPRQIALKKTCLSQWMKYLDSGYAIWFGMELSKKEMRKYKDNSFIKNHLADDTHGHQMVIVGYDTAYSGDSKDPADLNVRRLAFKVRNSWGADIHADGHFWLDANHLLYRLGSGSDYGTQPTVFTGLNKKTCFGFKEPRRDRQVNHALDFLQHNVIRELAYVQKEFEIIESMKHSLNILYLQFLHVDRYQYHINGSLRSVCNQLSHSWERDIRHLKQFNKKLDYRLYKENKCIDRIEKMLQNFSQHSKGKKPVFGTARKKLDEKSLQELEIYIKQSLKLVGTLDTKPLESFFNKTFKLRDGTSKTLKDIFHHTDNTIRYYDKVEKERLYDTTVTKQISKYLGSNLRHINKLYADIDHIRQLIILSHRSLSHKSMADKP